MLVVFLSLIAEYDYLLFSSIEVFMVHSCALKARPQGEVIQVSSRSRPCFKVHSVLGKRYLDSTYGFYCL